jgi:hypothetical protein
MDERGFLSLMNWAKIEEQGRLNDGHIAPFAC